MKRGTGENESHLPPLVFDTGRAQRREPRVGVVIKDAPWPEGLQIGEFEVERVPISAAGNLPGGSRWRRKWEIDIGLETNGTNLIWLGGKWGKQRR